MMEELLRQLIIVGSQPQLENKLIELWLYLGDQILSSTKFKSLKYYLNNEIEKMLGLLIFSDPVGIVGWNIKKWEPLKKMTNFITRWCDTVGHHPQCFSSLIRLLKNIGFNLIPEFGISWIYNCLSKVNDKKEFFERSRNDSFLAELLYDSWIKQEQLIKQNPETLKHFTYIVDILAELGVSIAILLQSRLRKTIYNNHYD